MGELSDHGGGLRFEITEEGDGSPVLKLDGELDMANADELDAAMTPVIARSPDRLVVDARGLAFGDSSAIALLVKWSNLTAVELREPPEVLKQVISRMGLTERLGVRP